MISSRRRHHTYRVIEGDTERNIEVTGRNAWMLDRLLSAGTAGCTSLEVGGACTTQYVCRLKNKYGLRIESIHEAHDGPFKGHHARYVLRSTVQRTFASVAPLND